MRQILFFLLIPALVWAADTPHTYHIEDYPVVEIELHADLTGNGREDTMLLLHDQSAPPKFLLVIKLTGDNGAVETRLYPKAIADARAPLKWRSGEFEVWARERDADPFETYYPVSPAPSGPHDLVLSTTYDRDGPHFDLVFRYDPALREFKLINIYQYVMTTNCFTMFTALFRFNNYFPDPFLLTDMESDNTAARLHVWMDYWDGSFTISKMIPPSFYTQYTDAKQAETSPEALQKVIDREFIVKGCTPDSYIDERYYHKTELEKSFDIARYLYQTGHYFEARELFDDIVYEKPDMIECDLYLSDISWHFVKTPYDRENAQKKDGKYIEKARAAGKADSIPRRVRERSPQFFN